MDLRGLINHARVAAQNVDYLKSFEMMVRRHVAGWLGISLQMNGTAGRAHFDNMRGQKIETPRMGRERRNPAAANPSPGKWRLPAFSA
ncbi:hypothetical protein [Pseudophaeobacter leonis]|uniref:hypothetical protein n=1 Tax=Pseudophaeobacter leonis TaxID=1144477 RepID=UPI00111C154F|nr:hypothetical protein [Pseudophaeobacter leonis]